MRNFPGIGSDADAVDGLLMMVEDFSKEAMWFFMCDIS
jgi:hypothetical protein